MAFQSVPGCAEAVIRFTSDGKEMVNVLGFRSISGSYTLADLQNLATAIDDAVATYYLPLVSNAVDYVLTEARGLEFEADQVATENTGAGPGTAGGNDLPSNVSLCITHRTGYTGRSARGRTYLVPTDISNLTSPKQFTLTYADDAVAMMNAIQTAAFSFSWAFCIISRFSAGVKRTEGIFTLVTSNVHRNRLIDSQRGRLANSH